MSKQKHEREVHGALDLLRRATEFVEASALARMYRRVDNYFSALDAASMKRNGGTDLFALWGRRIGFGLTVISFIVLGLWLLVQLGIL
jgi:hypothetical protein